MEILQSRITHNGKAIDRLAEAARSYITALISAGVQLEGIEDTKALKDYTVSALRDTYEAFGDQAATYAAITYEQYMKAYPNIKIEAATNEFDYDLSFLESKVTYQINRLDKDGLNRFSQIMGDMAFNFTRRCANQTIIKNANRDFDKGVRYARVPTGLKTCGFCVMLASRGFVYKTKESAGYNPFGFNRFHNWCDCRVVAGTEETKIEGYDPERLREVYSKARKTIEDDVKRRWNELTNTQKKAYGSYSKWITNNIISEINTRSPEWVYRGEAAKITSDTGAKPLPKEIKVANALSINGIECHFIERAKTEGKHTADMRIQNEKWEIKRPEGNLKAKTIGKNTIDHQFGEASKQSDRLILDLTVVETYESVGSKAEKEALRLFSTKWSDFSELLIVNSDGIKRYKNKK